MPVPVPGSGAARRRPPASSVAGSCTAFDEQRTSTTVTVTDLRGTEECRRGVQDGADAVPESVLTPALIPAVGRMPGAVGCRHFAPRDASVHHPEQALEQAPVRHSRTATWRLLRRQERRDLLPEGGAESSGPCPPDRERRGGGAPQGAPPPPPRAPPPRRGRAWARAAHPPPTPAPQGAHP